MFHRDEGKRRSGRTTRQLQSLPRGGLFICMYKLHVAEITKIIYSIGRHDITVYSWDEVINKYACRGQSFSEIYIDHCIGLDPEELDKLRQIRTLCCKMQ